MGTLIRRIVTFCCRIWEPSASTKTHPKRLQKRSETPSTLLKALSTPQIMGIPGLKIATAASPEAGYGILKAMIRDDGPGILCAGDPNGIQRELAQWVQCRKPLVSS